MSSVLYLALLCIFEYRDRRYLVDNLLPSSSNGADICISEWANEEWVRGAVSTMLPSHNHLLLGLPPPPFVLFELGCNAQNEAQTGFLPTSNSQDPLPDPHTGTYSISLCLIHETPGAFPKTPVFVILEVFR